MAVAPEVLVIDDDPDFRTLMRKIIEGMGLQVQEAQSVQAGIEVALSRAPHLVITDIKMSGEDGFAFLEKRKKLPALINVPTLVISEIEKPDLVYHAMSLGATDYVVKPIKPQLLIQKIKKALKDKGFRRVTYLDNKRPTVSATFRGRITRAGEPGVEFEAPVRLARLSSVKIESELLNSLELKDATFKVATQPAGLGSQGYYLNRLNALGLKEEVLQIIRKQVRFWK